MVKKRRVIEMEKLHMNNNSIMINKKYLYITLLITSFSFVYIENDVNHSGATDIQGCHYLNGLRHCHW